MKRVNELLVCFVLSMCANAIEIANFLLPTDEQKNESRLQKSVSLVHLLTLSTHLIEQWIYLGVGGRLEIWKRKTNPTRRGEIYLVFEDCVCLSLNHVVQTHKQQAETPLQQRRREQKGCTLTRDPWWYARVPSGWNNKRTSPSPLRNAQWQIVQVRIIWLVASRTSSFCERVKKHWHGTQRDPQKRTTTKKNNVETKSRVGNDY